MDLNKYLSAYRRDLPQYLQEIKDKALLDMVPILREETEDFLNTIIKLQKPKKILEVGTAVGFSTLLMFECSNKEAEIITIENYEPRINIARENISKFGNNKINLIADDATKVLKDLDEEFDLIFMDAAKGQYINWLEDLIRLSKDNGVILTDNIIQNGDTLESKFLVERRKRTIHKRVREYLYKIQRDERLTTSILPIGDGLSFSIVKKGVIDEKTGIISTCK